MKKQLKEALELHEKANQILELCQEAQKKVDSMCRWNVEQAIPNGFTQHSDEEIEFQERVVERIWRSYQVLVHKINQNTTL
jgi:hypothetical protein